MPRFAPYSRERHRGATAPREDTWVIDAPTRRGSQFLSPASLYLNPPPCLYWEFKRKPDLTYVAASAQPDPTLVNLGGSITPDVGPDRDTNLTNTSSATFVPWELNSGMRVGVDNSALGAFPNTFHDGIGVGCGGTFVFHFSFQTGLMPSAFFEASRHYGQVEWLDCTINITPVHATPRPWTVNTSVSAAPGIVTDRLYSALPEAQTTGVTGSVTTRPALTAFPVEAFWLRAPLSSYPTWAYNSQALWNSLGDIDIAKKVGVVDLLPRAGVPRINLSSTFSCTRRFHAIDWDFVPEYDLQMSQAPQALVNVQGTNSGFSTRPLSPILIPSGGLFSDTYYPIDAEDTIGAAASPVNIPLGTLFIDTNGWTCEYYPRGAANVQDFTAAHDYSAVDPVLMNPPMEWRVQYVVRTRFSQKPRFGGTQLGNAN